MSNEKSLLHRIQDSKALDLMVWFSCNQNVAGSTPRCSTAAVSLSIKFRLKYLNSKEPEFSKSLAVHLSNVICKQHSINTSAKRISNVNVPQQKPDASVKVLYKFS